MAGHVQVGTAIIVVRERKVLLGKRQGSHAAGQYSFPGGHLDMWETWPEGGVRETVEECGEDFKIKIRPFSSKRTEFFVTNDPMPECDKHYVTIFLVADYISGEPINAEPDKCEGWDWYTYDEAKELTAAPWVPWDLMEHYRQEIGI